MHEKGSPISIALTTALTICSRTPPMSWNARYCPRGSGPHLTSPGMRDGRHRAFDFAQDHVWLSRASTPHKLQDRRRIASLLQPISAHTPVFAAQLGGGIGCPTHSGPVGKPDSRLGPADGVLTGVAHRSMAGPRSPGTITLFGGLSYDNNRLDCPFR